MDPLKIIGAPNSCGFIAGENAEMARVKIGEKFPRNLYIIHFRSNLAIVEVYRTKVLKRSLAIVQAFKKILQSSLAIVEAYRKKAILQSSLAIVEAYRKKAILQSSITND